MAEDDCVFCKIIMKQIPAAVVYEDDVVLAFLDSGPISDGHTLVITKQHLKRLDECPGDILSQVGSKLPKIAKAVVGAVDCDGYNFLCNNGRAAGQIVNHLHFHIIPRKQDDGVFSKWPCYSYPEGKAEAIAKRIRMNL